MKVLYGEKGIIGVINISSCVNLEPEFYAMAPKGTAILTARVRLPKTTPEELAKLAKNACNAACELSTAKPDLIVFACTSGSFINGKGYDAEVAAMLSKAAGGIPVITTAEAVVKALNALGIKRFSLGTPYIEQVNAKAQAYFTANGFDVVKMQGLGLDTDYSIGLQTTDTVCKLAREVNSDEADAVVLSCTNLKTAPIIEQLEQELQKPIISANQATLWLALRSIGINDSLPELGKLMRI